MKSVILWLAATVIYCLALNFSPTVAGAHLGNETDRLALLGFRAHITEDPYGVLRSWNGSIHFCQWRGVICSNQHQRVIALDLGHQKLRGSLSPYIGNLSFLSVLHLHNNSFTHSIPQEIGLLRRLRYLWLFNNSFSGEIPPNISGCSKLINFDVSYNKLVGKIPEELVSLLDLQEISVSFNNLSGIVPSSLGNLSSLVKLNVAYNSLSGSIPETLGKLTKLEFFAVPVNNLSGVIPLPIFNISSMTKFTIVGNQLQGNLPLDMGITLPKLDFFAISGNPLGGEIPASLSNLSNMVYFQADGNNFTGKVPNLTKLNKLSWFIISNNQLGSGGYGDVDFISSMTNASSLEILALDNNNFGGELPRTFQNLSRNLIGLWMGNNQISGNILDGISNFVNLTRIQIPRNRFTGNIPLDVGMLQSLQVLQLSQNRFSGKIPSSLGNISLISMIYLEENGFNGNIPSDLGKCQNMIGLAVSQNMLSGTIPREVFFVEGLSYLVLSYNRLTGPLPLEVGSLQNLDELDVSMNFLSGEIPATLGSCVRLRNLYMNGNFFQGTIPPSLSFLKGVEFLDLSSNNLSGPIPKFLVDFDLQYLNLSYNNFEGNLPVGGIFKNASQFSVVGNTKLCGGVQELQLPGCTSNKSKISLNRKTKSIIIVIVGLLGLILLFISILFFWFKKKKKIPPSVSLENQYFQVSYGTLARATNGFSSENFVGKGSYGHVYKGNLEEVGTIVAVKVLNLSHNRAFRSFLAECEAMRNIRHRNLVKMLTVCSGLDYQGNDFKALVYEFMANGSLDEWLHPNQRDDLPETENKQLNLIQRLSIVIDVASALHYLHHDCQPPMAHCDVKPSNVLLDSELVGHLGDFGLAKFLLASTQNLSISDSSFSGVRGTIGYTAPEYGMGGQVSIQGDVYSFGVLVMEIVTGKRPTDGMFKEGFSLRNFSEQALSGGQMLDIADPWLLSELEEKKTRTEELKNKSFSKRHRVQECLVSILRIGISCSAESSSERMNIAAAASELQSTRRILLEIESHGNRKIK